MIYRHSPSKQLHEADTISFIWQWGNWNRKLRQSPNFTTTREKNGTFNLSGRFQNLCPHRNVSNQSSNPPYAFLYSLLICCSSFQAHPFILWGAGTGTLQTTFCFASWVFVALCPWGPRRRTQVFRKEREVTLSASESLSSVSITPTALYLDSRGPFLKQQLNSIRSLSLFFLIEV